MARIKIETPQKNRPIWLTTLLAFFPFDTRKEYPDQDTDGILSAIVKYLRDFSYKRRNTMQRLEVTHNIERTDTQITVRTFNDNPYIIIQIVK